MPFIGTSDSPLLVALKIKGLFPATLLVGKGLSQWKIRGSLLKDTTYLTTSVKAYPSFKSFSR